MNVGRDFDVSDPGEVEAYGFDFVNDLVPGDTISGVTWSCTVSEGVDPNASARLLGQPWLLSPTVTAQVVQGGVAGVSYVLQAVVRTGYGYTVSLWANARCETFSG